MIVYTEITASLESFCFLLYLFLMITVNLAYYCSGVRVVEKKKTRGAKKLSKRFVIGTDLITHKRYAIQKQSIDSTVIADNWSL